MYVGRREREDVENGERVRRESMESLSLQKSGMCDERGVVVVIMVVFVVVVVAVGQIDRRERGVVSSSYKTSNKRSTVVLQGGTKHVKESMQPLECLVLTWLSP